MNNHDVSEQQIADWKAKHSAVFCIEAEDGAKCYLHAPNKATLEAFLSNTKNTLKAIETIVKNCWLGGDESFKTDTGKLLSIGEHIEAIVDVKKSSCKSL